jgi:outer membrane lipoprotein SlyB
MIMATNEETVYENMPKAASAPQAEHVQQPEQKAKDNTFAKRAAVLGAAILSGGAIGGGAAYAMNNMGGATVTADDTAKVMTEDDSKSFEDAFNDARLQAGPGAAFRWHGGVYSTYTDEEWSKMSADEKAAYANRMAPQISDAERDSSHYAHNADTHDADVAHASAHNTAHEHDPQPGTHADGSYTINKEAVVEIDGKNYIAAEATHNGQKVLLLDGDQDGKYDVAVEDTNHDGNISDNEYVDITDKNIAVHDTALVDEIHTNENPVVEVGTDEEVVTMNDGTKVIAGMGNVDGKSGLLIDVNKDGTYDVAYVDKNGNGHIEEGEAVNISSSGAHVHDTSLVDGDVYTASNTEGGEGHLHDATDTMPDYVNNGVDSSADSGHQEYEVTASADTSAEDNAPDVTPNDDTLTAADDTAANSYNDMAFGSYDDGTVHGGTDDAMMMDHDGSV